MAINNGKNRKYIEEQQKKLQSEKRYRQRFERLFISTIVLFCVCAVLFGILNIVKNSPDHGLIVMRDRTAPAATVHNAVATNGQTYDIYDFVDEIDDLTDVELSYVNAPDFETDGSQEVIIRFTDEAGNYTDKSLLLEVVHDREAPEIIVDDDVYVYWGEAVSYKSLIEISDNMDDDLTIEVENDEVDINTIGSYPVTYTVTDSAGNASTRTITLHVLEPDSDEYYLMKANELCDTIIAQIITPDMDKLHQVWAVYEYVRAIPYILTDYTRNYIREGYKMLSEYRGDCYGSYASVRLLLDRLGIDNLPIQTDENWTRHFWNLVSVDGGNTWYHVDATNWVEWSYLPNMCMISDAALNQISADHQGTHIFEADLYPATPAYSLEIPADIQAAYGVWNEYN